MNTDFTAFNLHTQPASEATEAPLRFDHVVLGQRPGANGFDAEGWPTAHASTNLSGVPGRITPGLEYFSRLFTERDAA
ncbi:MAG: hypothetical protein COT92_03825 [Candidatus Doudnabacteria bacterium CG10_big_fil_rev_8_21_14_0_10_42_18]|uniref:Uncharacterized protein n=1 Tax=Candidatus Doudnabacteria bacterium CG10_big_fil_rev_8_21_14_0_10_42_18 TaxID=1974552 RepID=A0A2H0VA17_9BACT|nr:MAG: hypothetical protein COT92_03825 [Candidatus Doudnabacteria bacterium CG10_big_fil_rev_8_21_14_0_10_42_18]